MDLTRDELFFLTRQGLTDQHVLDGRRMSKEQIRLVAKDQGKSVVLGSACAKAGHRLRTRSGHCVQCDPAKLGYQKRHRAQSEVYIAISRSSGLVKVGNSTNCDVRISKINFDGVGGTKDWQLIFRLPVEEGGRLEIETQVLLSEYMVVTSYMKDGRPQDSRECFRCSPGRALEAILRAAQSGGHVIGEPWRSTDFPR
ncbi:hypothetical protein [Bosea sp. AK1]|uniref:hypothetical protein n=1 Tax=Bosea sp. AK1 TaxID=2587160 RepID=UPI00114EC8A7|nr:hypothetical protein [Bosea sp. AK1]